MADGVMINFGIVGAGRRAGSLSQYLQKPAKGYRLAGVCDSDERALSAFSHHRGILLSNDLENFISRETIDAILILTPDYLHAEHSIAALNARKFVYLEKPFEISVERCDRILQTSGKYKDRLYVGHNLRFTPVFRRMKELIAEGRIGKVETIWGRHFISYGGDAYFKDWHSERRYANSLLLQKASHDIDLMHWWAGGFTRRVVGMGKLSVYNGVENKRSLEEKADTAFRLENWPPKAQTEISPVVDVEDHSMVLMQFDNGVQGMYGQCHYTPDAHRNFTVIGTHGRLENCGDYSSSATIRLWTSRCQYTEEGTEFIDIPKSPQGHGGADPLIMKDFVRFIKGEKTWGATPLEARMSAVAGCMATESLRNGNLPYDIPPPSLF